MTLRDLETLLDYHYWARDRLLEAVETLAPEQFTRHLIISVGSIRDTAAHANVVAEYAASHSSAQSLLVRPAGAGGTRARISL